MHKIYELKPMIFQETLSLFYILQPWHKTHPTCLELYQVSRRMLGTWTRLLSYWHYQNQITALRTYLEHVMKCLTEVEKLDSSPFHSKLAIKTRNQIFKIVLLIQQLLTEKSIFSQHTNTQALKYTPPLFPTSVLPKHPEDNVVHITPEKEKPR